MTEGITSYITYSHGVTGKNHNVNHVKSSKDNKTEILAKILHENLASNESAGNVMRDLRGTPISYLPRARAHTSWMDGGIGKAPTFEGTMDKTG